MQRVRSTGSAVELRVRRTAHSLGLRFRLHRRDLPGTPDLTFASRRIAVFIHGCFWHGHNCPRGAREPQTNRTYWRAKIARNRDRDASAVSRIEDLGWTAVTIWECEAGTVEEAMNLIQSRILNLKAL